MKGKLGRKLKFAVSGLCALFLIGILPAGFSGGVNNVQTIQAATEVKISKTEETIIVGDSAKLEITGTRKKVIWKSSNTEVATVSEWGNVRAKKKGVVQITATVGNETYTCEVTVVEAPSINKEYIELEEGESYQLKIKNANQTVTWDIDSLFSSYGCIKLSSSGKVTAIDTGEAVVIAKVGNRKFECKILVKPRQIKFNEKKKDSVDDLGLNKYRFIIEKKQKVAITITSTSKNDPVGKLKVSLHKNEGYYPDKIDEQFIFFPYQTKKTLYFTLEPGEYYIYVSDDRDYKSEFYSFSYGYTIKINTTSSKAKAYELDETNLTTQVGSPHQILLINENDSAIQRNLISWKSSPGCGIIILH